ncbi:MAG: K+/H+ antiporter [Bacteroidetes bacterium GWF2_43_63]|nr:MAG: K+/H+ antiporter [Bacteroidetes bacterium GWE2_42_42]OFY55118.1 MAG: K+/H+ antiporter [Bacteroidetes bacterium GWF2_43_63]HBG70264.1 potassium/proton antiporter [Bacteroidales bacterium]HCB63064.1 potassium/proton antiporter [Bacteroidales bacterium]HCY22717.1 potassium/proton antiporter [Bacteroidales bacterium]
MTLTIENIMLIGSLLLFASIIIARNSARFGLPMLVFFLAVGMLAGSEGLGGIQFNDPQIAQFIGVISLCVILFSSGLETDWARVQPIVGRGIMLSTFGVILTATFIGLFVWQMTDFTIFEGLLLGAIVSSTDAAAVFSILREKNLALKSGLRPTLELESGSNDPMAFVLVIGLLELVVNSATGVTDVLQSFVAHMAVGAAAGFGFGFVGKEIINRIKLTFEGLYPILMLSLVYITFYATDLIEGNGFLAVYICGVYLGNQKLMHKRTILKMFDATAWLMQIILFLTLGLLVYPSHIIPFLGIGLAISAFLILVARPVAVLISLLPFKFPTREKLFISWVGLRGAVPIVFATYPLLAGIDKAGVIFNVVFFISLSSVLVQGTTLHVIARWLKVTVPRSMRQQTAIDRILDDEDKSALEEIIIPEGGYAIGKRIVDLRFPATSIIAMIRRGDRFVTPKGSTVIEACDVLMILSEDKKDLPVVYRSLKLKDANSTETQLNTPFRKQALRLRSLFRKRG